MSKMQEFTEAGCSDVRVTVKFMGILTFEAAVFLTVRGNRFIAQATCMHLPCINIST